MLWWLPNDVQYILPWPLSGVVVCLCVRIHFLLHCVCVCVFVSRKNKRMSNCPTLFKRVCCV